MILGRIQKESYIPFIKKASKVKWQSVTNEEVIKCILSITECHPYYVNFVCSRLWRAPHPPTLSTVEQCWEQIQQEELGDVAAKVEKLSINQKRLLQYIAMKAPLKRPSSRETIAALNISSRGIMQSLKGLENMDFIEKTKEGIHIVDPLIRSILVKA